MSHVTNLIITTPSNGDESFEPPAISALNAWLVENYGEYSGFKEVSEYAGGRKAMERTVYLTAINYLATDDFLKIFSSLEWDSPEWVQLFICEQDDETFTIHQPPVGTEPSEG